MWKVECDCCGEIERGKLGDHVLPDGWYSIQWKCEGRNDWGADNPDHDEFLLCRGCFSTWRSQISQTRLRISSAVLNLLSAHELAKGFGNQGNAAAGKIEYALEFLGQKGLI